ncbi:damage-inducible mutagenesis protein [Methylobacterium mesophilicum SR1.6/6]|uniref:Damage-inducible mutagenesis protein n=2 Tax=Methylobacterium mesophilicum TaxID=39956 RepID=A0A6B9FGF6_9HYPH|nr:damage-inducible mutagenesis protein [Methylobacterium mesophilicum]QGY01209.1 damage-inducible mutagenesis protein [Methylobacterium mesophilicum SR1.6/6]
MQRETLRQLRDEIACLERGTRTHATARSAHLPFGVDALDARLPDGGLRLGALQEIAPAEPGLAHAAARTLFTAGILARLPGPVLWCLSARDLFAPGLAGAGLHPDRVIYAETYRDDAVLPLLEEGARCAGLAAVVGEVSRAGLTGTRRLQLAAEASGVSVLLLRRIGRDPAPLSAPSAALTRWRVAAHPSAELPTPGLGRARWRVELARCRGAPAGTEDCRWVLEACDETGRLALAADLVDRSAAARRHERAAAR